MQETQTTGPTGDDLLASDCPRFSITADSAHFREHWAEMVATQLPNLRLSRRWSLIFGLVAALSALPLGALPQWLRAPSVTGVVALCFCLLLGGSYLWKRHRWLSMAKRHPRFGQNLIFLVSDGGISQHPAAVGPEAGPREAEFEETPGGYFLRFPLLQDRGLGPHFAQSESVYLPHGSLQPPMSKQDLGALIKTG